MFTAAIHLIRLVISTRTEADDTVGVIDFRFARGLSDVARYNNYLDGITDVVGNGLTGGDFVFSLNVLFGDLDGDGMVG